MRRLTSAIILVLLTCINLYSATEVVRIGPEYFPNPSVGRPISSGSIYIGEPGTDPTVAINQKKVSIIQEGGTQVNITQPISTGAGGLPVYNGSPVALLVDAPYSIKILDQYGSQLYYSDNSINSSSFSTKASLESSELAVGGSYSTQGYYSSGDGGQSTYYIKTLADFGSTPDGYCNFTVNSGEGVAVLQYSGRLNVKQCGAKGNDSDDDLLPITAVADYLDEEGGGTPYIPTGIYRVSGAIPVYDNIHFEGDGPRATVVKSISATANVFDANVATNWSISGIEIQQLSTVTRTAGAGISVYDGGQFRIEDINIYDMFYGISLNGSGVATTQVGYISKVNIRECVPITGIGIRILKGLELFFSDITINAVAGLEPAAGIVINSSQSAYFTDVAILHQVQGLLIHAPGVADVITWIRAKNLLADNCTASGIWIRHGSGQIYGIDLADSWSSTNTLYGVRITSDGGVASSRFDGVTLTNHTAVNNGLHGVTVSDLKNFKMVGGTLSGNSTTTPGVSSGLQLEADMSDYSVIGLTSGTSFSYSATQKFGINAVSGTNNNYIIANCKLEGNTDAGLFHPSPGENSLVYGNLPKSGNSVLSSLSGSKTWDPSSIGAGGVTGTTLAVTGAVVGDVVIAGFSEILSTDMTLTATVSTDGACRVVLYNASAGSIDLASGTLTVKVIK